MTFFQTVLAVGVIIIGIYMYLRLRNTLLDMGLIALFIVTGLLFILFPGITNKIAHWVGVGRGADMIFYLSILLNIKIIFPIKTCRTKLDRIS